MSVGTSRWYFILQNYINNSSKLRNKIFNYFLLFKAICFTVRHLRWLLLLRNILICVCFFFFICKILNRGGVVWINIVYWNRIKLIDNNKEKSSNLIFGMQMYSIKICSSFCISFGIKFNTVILSRT